MFGIGGFEFVIILVVALFLFGPDKLPEIGKNVGKALKMFNKAKNEFETVVKTDILKPEDMKAMRDMQEDLHSITNVVKNPMSMLQTTAAESAERLKNDMLGTNEKGSSSRPRSDAAAECSEEPSRSSAPLTEDADSPAAESDARTPQQARANTPQRSEDVSASPAEASNTPQSSAAQDIWSATLDINAKED